MAGFSTFTGLVFFLSVIFYHLPFAAALVFNYTSFTTSNYTSIKVEGDAKINDTGGWIEVTGRKDSRIGDSRGRASYAASPVPLWDAVTGEVASFTTRFTFVIDPQSKYGGIDNKGAGMAFFLAAGSMPPDSYAYDLSLTGQNPAAIAAGDARFVAVEFDTFNDTEALDPNTTYDHVGIDVNSIRSVATKVLQSFSLMGDMTAEIKFDNISSLLELKLWLGSDTTPYKLSHKVDLKNALPENVTVGFSASTSTSVELHQVHSWYFSSSLEPKPAPIIAPPPPPPPPPPSPTPSMSSARRGGGVIEGASVGAALFIVLLFATAAALLARRLRRSKRRMEEMLEDFGELDGSDNGDEPIMEIEMGAGPRRFPYHELVAATRSFSPEEKLGQGGFGAVYRGHLTDHGAVAIKRFAKGSSMQGRKEYKSEIKVISRLRHRNLVKLVGWCHGRDELLLVYELVPNRSLDVHLHSDGDGVFLTWPMRINILLGLGSALLYLHEEWEQCVVHRDVKPSNVMLDQHFNAKLGDFGLARFIDHAGGMQTMTAVSGTPGYVDLESLITGKASAESDVYSFGVVVLEVMSGRRPMSLLPDAGGNVFRLVEWAWDMYGRGAAVAAADERLGGEYDAAEVERAVAVGLWCAHPDPRARPSIRAAMAALQPGGGGQLPALPAKMPVPTYAPPPVVISPEGLFSQSTVLSAVVTSSGLTKSSATTNTSCVSDTSSGSTGLKDSSSLLKHQY
ncbi:hypothetical protein HU200_049059 [Digitaria exilis]|uniref:non-specific serine/threonine protein kinase n=1 Tax=Digitaria exilis TaxID=1010633 RepID=A0A835AWP8_9POAL|nr:hypothetical protein HU200_049058 [Digitaria exilis]KAF8672991.1 hypothetical protein HU200_049059 [Digitaria exilis]